MNDIFFKGKLVNLVPLDIEKEMTLWEKWSRDSEYARQLDIVPAAQYCASISKEFFEDHSGSGALFMIHTVEGIKLSGL